MANFDHLLNVADRLRAKDSKGRGVDLAGTVGGGAASGAGDERPDGFGSPSDGEGEGGGEADQSAVEGDASSVASSTTSAGSGKKKKKKKPGSVGFADEVDDVADESADRWKLEPELRQRAVCGFPGDRKPRKLVDVLIRKPQNGDMLGFTLGGGSDCADEAKRAIFVVSTGTVSRHAVQNTLAKGDAIITIDGMDMMDATLKTAAMALLAADTELRLQVARKQKRRRDRRSQHMTFGAHDRIGTMAGVAGLAELRYLMRLGIEPKLRAASASNPAPMETQWPVDPAEWASRRKGKLKGRRGKSGSMLGFLFSRRARASSGSAPGTSLGPGVA